MDGIDRSAIDEDAIQEMKEQEPDPPDPRRGITINESGYQVAKSVKGEFETWNQLLINLVRESGRAADAEEPGPIAWICEVNTGDHGGVDGWREHVSRDHPGEVFNHIPYRNVRALYTDAEQSGESE